MKLAPLVEAANLVPRYAPLPPYPAVTRDLNLVVDESVRWADVAATVRANGGPYFEGLEYRDTYRDPQRLGAGKKSLLMTIALRSNEGTLTSQQADEIRDQIVAACRDEARGGVEGVRREEEEEGRRERNARRLRLAGIRRPEETAYSFPVAPEVTLLGSLPVAPAVRARPLLTRGY